MLPKAIEILEEAAPHELGMPGPQPYLGAFFIRSIFADSHTWRSIVRISNEEAPCRGLRQIPGFSPLVSTAPVAAIGNGAAFAADATSRLGSASYHGSTPPGQAEAIRHQ